MGVGTIDLMAPRVKALINPALITWARRSAGFTMAEAATRLDVDEGRLTAWEAVPAADAPSIPQLRKIAALFRRPLAVFYMAAPPEGFAVMRDYDASPELARGIIRLNCKWKFATVNERRELAVELATDLELEYRSSHSARPWRRIRKPSVPVSVRPSA